MKTSPARFHALQARREGMQAEPVFEHAVEEQKLIERFPAGAVVQCVDTWHPRASHLADARLNAEDRPIGVEGEHPVRPPLHVSLPEHARE